MLMSDVFLIQVVPLVIVLYQEMKVKRSTYFFLEDETTPEKNKEAS
jgi:hypothetical protein